MLQFYIWALKLQMWSIPHVFHKKKTQNQFIKQF